MINKNNEIEKEIEELVKNNTCGEFDGLIRLKQAELKGFQLGLPKAKDDFKENMLMTKSNHQLGCMLECYEQVICNRIGFEKEAKQLKEIASRLK